MRSAQEFALDFRTLAACTGWNEQTLIDHYRCSLREDVRRELVGAGEVLQVIEVAAEHW
jgi:hypothetical protein